MSAPYPTPDLRVLQGVRILSLALNLPGPAALMRCQHMGAICRKLEPPAPPSAPSAPTPSSGDPMGSYNRQAYDALHAGIDVQCADLKTEQGQHTLHQALAQSDIVLTSFRPSALQKLGLSWERLHAQYPRLSMVCIVGAPGAQAEAPGHDLTYLAEHALITGLNLPPTLYADMTGSLMASEAVLQAHLARLQTGHGVVLEVALSTAAAYAALPHHWGLTQPGAAVGGGHAGYKVYACKDGRVALAALEPHFAQALLSAVGLPPPSGADLMRTMFSPQTHAAVATYCADHTRQALEALSTTHDIPLCTLA